MKNTLLISDLDGTLLNKEGQLSAYTISVVNAFIAQGGKFSVATGRSLETSRPILEKLDLNLPVVLSNGVSLYDTTENRYISMATLSPAEIEQVDSILTSHGLLGFFYMLEDGHTAMIHRPLQNAEQELYLNTRVKAYGPYIYETNSISKEVLSRRPYFCVSYGSRDAMTEVAHEIDRTGSMQTALYSDIYNNRFFMDIFSTQASKLSGLQTVQKISRASRSVAFGDNYNDLSMIEGANESYVPSNAVAELKAIATDVIAHHAEDAIAKYIVQKYL